LHVRVGTSAPSLWANSCSVTWTGINLRPVCTAIVCAIMSGRFVDRRDHFLITFFSLRAFIPETFNCRCSSMNGPFLSERPIVSPCEPALVDSRSRESFFADHSYPIILIRSFFADEFPGETFFAAYSSTRRHLTHCARRNLRKPRT